GKPTAARAVGNAVGSNPIAIVVPCHRVVPAAGGVGNYGGGPERKAFLLDLERSNETTPRRRPLEPGRRRERTGRSPDAALASGPCRPGRRAGWDSSRRAAPAAAASPSP